MAALVGRGNEESVRSVSKVEALVGDWRGVMVKEFQRSQGIDAEETRRTNEHIHSRSRLGVFHPST